MRLNTLTPAAGSRSERKRVGRGSGSGLGKTCGRGHKGQHSRSGGFHKVGFEGGQMPLQRRVPKYGFTSQKGLRTAEVRLNEIARIDGEVVDLAALKKAGLISKNMRFVKIISSGGVERSLVVRLGNIKITQGARRAVEAAGGRVEEG